MLMSVKDLHRAEIGGCEYWLRTPDVYDPAKMRRVLTRQGVRRPDPVELRVAALAGVAAMAEAVGDPSEGERQKALLEEWYEASKPLDEDELDEPDFELRATELARLKAEQTKSIARLWPQVAAIEANLERHYPPYRELLADREYWDDVSRIEIVRLLLVRRADAPLPRDEDGLMTPAAYQAIPREHRLPLATFAFRLLAPGETQTKN